MNKKLYIGECSDVIKESIGDNVIDLVVTSPPYDDLREYNGYTFNYKDVLTSIYNALKPGGVCVWVVGDSVKNGSETGNSFRHAICALEIGFRLHDTMIYKKDNPSFPSHRKSIRYSQIFEYMFIFSKGKPKTVNLICDKKNKWGGQTTWGSHRDKHGNLIKGKVIKVKEYAPRENIWEYATGLNCTTKDKIAYQHPAIFPEELAKDHILTWSNEGDTVLDPMCGSGTTLKMAKLTNRNYIGIDVSSEYIELTKERLNLIK